MSRLLDAAADARFVFVVGKGGVGKTTTAAALALASGDAGTPTHLISTDPAHSLDDLFGGERCSDRLVVEEFDAAARATDWLAATLGPVAGLVERGTYLDAEDVTAFSRLALPGVDEMMAVLRLGDLTAERAGRIVVDTAPTGHTLRLLDAAVTFASVAGALRAMAAKGHAVAAGMIGGPVELAGESIIDDLEETVRRYRRDVLGRAAFVVAARAGVVVEAETRRLVLALHERRLRTAAVVWTGAPGRLDGAPAFNVPWLGDVRGCSALREWSGAVAPVSEAGTEDSRVVERTARAAPATDSFARWLRSEAPPLLLFAGKGGVGKSTCAAAAALTLAQDRDTLLCSADPAGSIDDVLGGESAARLRTLQIEPAAELGRLRGEYAGDVNAALERLGLSESAALDRRVIESLWDLSPPGLDEVAATVAMLGAAATAETIVLDAAPTGHFLRMLETPETALAWTRQLMRVIVKYGIAGVAANAAESLLRLARGLRELAARLRDPERTAVVIVTLDEPLVHAETRRLQEALSAAGIRVAATILNRAANGASASTEAAGVRVRAPDATALRGVDALREFAGTWNIVT